MTIEQEFEQFFKDKVKNAKKDFIRPLGCLENDNLNDWELEQQEENARKILLDIAWKKQVKYLKGV